MARHAKAMTAREAETMADGKRADGRGLYLVVNGDYRAWFFFYTSPGGRRREMLLAHQRDCSLKEARAKADEARTKLKGGVDPLGEREERRVEAAKVTDAGDVTLRRFARTYHENIESKFTNDKVAAQWISDLERHVFPKLGDKPLAAVTAGDVLDLMRPLFRDIPATARKIRQRLETIYDEALLRDLVVSNPASRVKNALKQPANGSHWRSLPYKELPALLRRVRELPGTSARALEFVALTAARTEEVLGMTWSEVSADGKTWTVPAARMKGREEHVVSLSTQSRAVLRRVQGLSSVYVFPSPVRADRPMSNMAMLILLRRLGVEEQTTIHGLRTAFSTWANETGAARPDVIEACLAHREADKVRAAFNRAKFQSERAQLFAEWAAYLAD